MLMMIIIMIINKYIQIKQDTNTLCVIVTESVFLQCHVAFSTTFGNIDVDFGETLSNAQHKTKSYFVIITIICNSNRSASAGPLLRSLHWLPVQQRINFKLAKLCYLVTSFQQPGYLADLISPYSQSRSLRSSTQKFLSVPPHNLFLCCCSKTLELSSSQLSNCSIC